MKPILLLLMACLFSHPGQLRSATARLPDIPPAKLTACQALELALKQFPKDTKLQVVAVEWCPPSNFQPRLSDGTQYHVLDAPDEWSWFVTLVDPDAAKTNKPSPVSVIRVRNDGSIGALTGTRT